MDFKENEISKETERKCQVMPYSAWEEASARINAHKEVNKFFKEIGMDPDLMIDVRMLAEYMGFEFDILSASKPFIGWLVYDGLHGIKEIWFREDFIYDDKKQIEIVSFFLARLYFLKKETQASEKYNKDFKKVLTKIKRKIKKTYTIEESKELEEQLREELLSKGLTADYPISEKYEEEYKGSPTLLFAKDLSARDNTFFVTPEQ